MRTTVKARDLAAGMEKQRRRDRARRCSMKGRQLMLEGVNADHIYGVDESGRRVDLKVNADGLKVLIGFKRERALGEGFVEGDPIQRTTVVSTTDVYHAVRAMKYIRQAHAKELKRNEALCQNIDALHALLYTRGNLIDERRLTEIRDMLAAYNAEESGSSSVYKQLASRKMDEVLEKLAQAIWERTAFKRRSSITQACSLLTAFKNRYLWREGQVMGINIYDKVREDGFRAIRDHRLKGVLLDLAKKLEGDRKSNV
jgi:hypothetical protein